MRRLRSFCSLIPPETPTIFSNKIMNEDMDWLNLSHISFPMNEKDESVTVVSEDKNSRMNIRWDPDSGQFSLTQGSQLEQASLIVRELAVTNPDSVAIIWRKDQQASEEMATYSQLNHMMNHIQEIIDEKPSKDSDAVTLVYLPVSIIAVAAMLACTSIQQRHSLVFAGFSSSALSSLMETGQVGTVISSDYWPVLTNTLHTVVGRWPQIRTINLDVNCGVVLPRTVENLNTDEFNLELTESYGEDLSPLFALYTGGETSVIAGLKEEAGYYQVTSNVGISGVEKLSPPCPNGEAVPFQTPEQNFKERKRQNTYRLDYIDKMLQDK